MLFNIKGDYEKENSRSDHPYFFSNQTIFDIIQIEDKLLNLSLH